MRKWTEEARRQQAEKIRRWKPWQRSTGPKTPDGKLRSAQNATQSGQYSATTKAQYRAWRREFKAAVNIMDAVSGLPYQRFKNNFPSLSEAVSAMRGE